MFGTFVVAPGFRGLSSFAILSGSMEPTLRVGDLVIDRRVEARDVRPGDIVTFREPGRRFTPADAPDRALPRPRRPGLHVTRGDANSGVESWTIPPDGTVGRVEFDVPKLGHLTTRIGDRFGRVALVVVPALLLGLFELKRLWFPKRRPDDG